MDKRIIKFKENNSRKKNLTILNKEQEENHSMRNKMKLRFTSQINKLLHSSSQSNSNIIKNNFGNDESNYENYVDSVIQNLYNYQKNILSVKKDLASLKREYATIPLYAKNRKQKRNSVNNSIKMKQLLSFTTNKIILKNSILPFLLNRKLKFEELKVKSKEHKFNILLNKIHPPFSFPNSNEDNSDSNKLLTLFPKAIVRNVTSLKSFQNYSIKSKENQTNKRNLSIPNFNRLILKSKQARWQSLVKSSINFMNQYLYTSRMIVKK